MYGLCRPPQLLHAAHLHFMCEMPLGRAHWDIHCVIAVQRTDLLYLYPLLTWQITFWVAFAAQRKATVSFVMSVCQPAWNKPAPDWRIFMKFDYFRKSAEEMLGSLLLLTAVGLSPGGSGYFTCIQNMKLVTTKFKSRGLHEKHVVATWNLGKHLSICF